MMMAADLRGVGELVAEKLWCRQLMKRIMMKVVDELSKLGEKKQKG